MDNFMFPKNLNQQKQNMQEHEQLLEYLKSNPELMKKYQQEVTKMQKNTKQHMKTQPMSSKQYLQKVKSKQIQTFLDTEGGLIILPEKGFVVKLFDKRTNQKIFVNILKHEAVDHPEEKLLIDLQNQPGLRIPMSMGVVKQDSDKKGIVCKVVDVVMNTKIVEIAEKTEDVYVFMMQIISNYLLEKHKINVAQQKMIKVQMKYKGNNVDIQRVRAKKSPKIEQVKDPMQKSKQQQQEEQKLLDSLSGGNNSKVIMPQFRMHIITEDNQRQEFSHQNKQYAVKYEITLNLDHLIHSRGIHLEASSNFVYLMVKGLYEICLKMPIDMRRYKACFSRKSRQLRIECDISKEEKVEQTTQEKKKIEIKFENEYLDQLVM